MDVIVKRVPFKLQIEEVPVEPPDFFPAIDPDFLSVPKGVAATYHISFREVAGYANPISLAVIGLPDGVVSMFNINPCMVTDTVTLTLTANAMPGLYNLELETTEVVPA